MSVVTFARIQRSFKLQTVLFKPPGGSQPINGPLAQNRRKCTQHFQVHSEAAETTEIEGPIQCLIFPPRDRWDSARSVDSTATFDTDEEQLVNFVRKDSDVLWFTQRCHLWTGSSPDHRTKMKRSPPFSLALSLSLSSSSSSSSSSSLYLPPSPFPLSLIT